MLLLTITLSILPGAFLGQAAKTYTQVYQVRDPRFCFLTPRPFICKRCLRAGKRFARFLSFDEDGRPTRKYGCVIEKKNFAR